MKRILLALVLVAGGLLGAPGGFAATGPDEVLADPAQEARARALSKQLRCLVCQNQSIDDSDAELAQDLRRVVREQIAAGESDAEIIGFLTARYGDFVLLKPPVKPATWGLWFGPFAVLALAAAGVVLYLGRRRRPGQAPAELSAAERARLAALLAEPDAHDRSGTRA